MSNIIIEQQRFLDFALGHCFSWQNGLQCGLYKYGFTGTIFQKQNTIISVEAKCCIKISLVAIVVDNIGETDSTDGRHD